MQAHIPVKHLLLMLFIGLLCAAGMVFLLNFLLAGPRLGAHYDFLLNFKAPPVVSNEILIIDTDEVVEGHDLFTVFMILTEMNASTLIMTGRISPASSPITLTEAEIRRRFMDEYNLISSNIRNLFEGIRMGFVLPVSAPAYVERVVELTEQSRERLLSALVDRDEDLIRASYVFGRYMEAQGFSADWDGRIRRVRPTGTALNQIGFKEVYFEHPVFLDFKNRFLAAQVEDADYRQILWLRSPDGNEFDIPLDKNGNVITPWNADFRRIDISLFREYEKADFELLDALEFFEEIRLTLSFLPQQPEIDEPEPELELELAPEQADLFVVNLGISPLFLGEYAFALRNEMLTYPSIENRHAWRAARENYIQNLHDYFYSPSAGVFILENEAFAQAYEKYRNFYAIHSQLRDMLMFAYCIMGPYNDSLYSALIANVMITGAHVNPAYWRAIIFWSILSAFIVLISIFLMRPILVLICGVSLSFLSALVFAVIFVVNSYWLDPLIVFGGCFAGSIVIFYCKCALLNRRTRSFKAAYGAVVSKTFLQNLILCGRPRLPEINAAFAAIIAIKDINLLNDEDQEEEQNAGTARDAFISSVKKVLFNAGAVIVGFEGDTILACFGSPLELQSNRALYKWSSFAKSYNPMDKACALVRELLEIENNTWHFGIDAGECTFYWSPETGYSAKGRPAVRARLLLAKTIRLKTRALITDVIGKKLNIEGRPLGCLYGKNDTFYALN